MSNELIGRIDRMLCCYPTKTINKVLQDCKAALTQQQEFRAATEDCLLYGTGIMLNGKRIDPAEVCLYPESQQQEAEPVTVERFTEDGLKAIVTGIQVCCLDIGDKLYKHPPAAHPVISAEFEYSEDGITGTQSAPVKRVETQDDGSLTVVLDYWPAQAAQPQVPEGYIKGVNDARRELKQLCKDFSDLRDRPYMGDVYAAIDGVIDMMLSAAKEES